MSDIVNKLRGFCHTLRHDGIDCGDYIEQLPQEVEPGNTSSKQPDGSDVAFQRSRKETKS